MDTVPWIPYCSLDKGAMLIGATMLNRCREEWDAARCNPCGRTAKPTKTEHFEIDAPQLLRRDRSDAVLDSR
jgi:hypothetical protein